MYNIEIIRSKRKTLSLEIKPDLSITVRTPQYMTDNEIKRFIEEKSVWIKKHISEMKKRAMPSGPKLTGEEIRILSDSARDDLSERVNKYAPIIGVTAKRITVRHQKTRWGSCSSKGNLSFNCLLMLCPGEVRDYVVVHELCHLKELNHSHRFWADVGQVFPEYKECRRWLKENGNSIIGRLE